MIGKRGVTAIRDVRVRRRSSLIVPVGAGYGAQPSHTGEVAVSQPCARRAACTRVHSMHHSLACLAILAPFAGCATTNDVAVELAPDLISSIDGTLSVHALALSDRDPVGGDKIDVTVEYTDRNGTAHPIDPLTGSIDDNGAFEGAFTGLKWDGTGTVTAVVHGGDGDVTGTATFAVLDRSPPVITITPPTSIRVNQDATITVHVTDEIGISQVSFEANFSGNGGNGNGNRQRSTVVSAGLLDANLTFDIRAQDTQAGATLTLYALGSDLSGNQAAAKPVSITVTP